MNTFIRLVRCMLCLTVYDAHVHKVCPNCEGKQK
jgi:hypothetical protein